VLCRSCAQEVPPCEGLIPDHIHSRTDSADADAWAVDGFGIAHAIAAQTGIGRSQDGQLVVLASSVSREHAELKQNDAGWTVKDLGSRNGTFVNGQRMNGKHPLPARAVLKIGDVAMWFLAEVVHEPDRPPSMATETAGGGIVRYLLSPQGVELCVVGGSDTAGGGSLLSRPAGTEAWKETGLAPLEFQLLRTLCARAIEDATSPATVRGCVATKQLVRDLPFQSRFANEENVRQVVKRLRTNLAEIGANDVLAAAPGRGYYLTCPVIVGGSSPR